MLILNYVHHSTLQCTVKWVLSVFDRYLHSFWNCKWNDYPYLCGLEIFSPKKYLKQFFQDLFGLFCPWSRSTTWGSFLYSPGHMWLCSAWSPRATSSSRTCLRGSSGSSCPSWWWSSTTSWPTCLASRWAGLLWFNWAPRRHGRGSLEGGLPQLLWVSASPTSCVRWASNSFI